MAFELIFDKKALRELNGLEQETKRRIFSKLRQAKEEPKLFFERLQGRQDYKLRVGDYRVIADLDFGKKQILVTKAGHRRNVYD
ncbi:MAG: type II toxin-antitoxin system RelE/ParE family toxin [Candidatus Diapherotrites archaeon]|nr:type II toxin-antitoxin system RelE/ParE family toxin [Candidatus Diapherotrites archaeon]